MQNLSWKYDLECVKEVIDAGRHQEPWLEQQEVMDMFMNNYSRRDFIKKNTTAGVGAALAIGAIPSLFSNVLNDEGTPAVLGGQAVRSKDWPDWPRWNPETDEKLLLEVMRSGTWSRSRVVAEFEDKFASAVGSKRCLTVVNGTNAMIVSLMQLGVGGGDEVIVPPYTFIATIDAVLATGAIPVFVDTDPETFQIDSSKIEEKITSRTKAILPVHICGIPADMITIMGIAKKHGLLVVEDCAQAHMAEIGNKQVGTFGNSGCFSFQNSKNFPIGEGGAIVSDDEEFIDKCFSYHNFGVSTRSMVDDYGKGYVIPGNKLRLTEYQAAIGLTRFRTFQKETTLRNLNAEYLKSKLKDIPGILPFKLYPNVTRTSLHLFPFRYKKEEYNGLSKEDYLIALRAEGIPCSGGYSAINKHPYLKETFQSKNYKQMYSKEMLDYDSYMERNECPINDRLCSDEAIWFSQSMLLGDKSDMNDIANAMIKIHANSAKIRRGK